MSYRTASDGFWTILLIPLAILLNDEERVFKSILVIVTFNSVVIALFKVSKIDFQILLPKIQKLNLAFSCFTLIFCIDRGGSAYLFFSYIAINYSFPYMFTSLLKIFPKSFTFGEAIIVCQGFFLSFFAATKFVTEASSEIHSESHTVNTVLIGHVGYLVCVLVCRSLLFMVKPWKFSLLDILFCSWAAGSLGTFLLSTSLNDFLLLGDWIFRGFIDNTRAKLIVSWLALTAASIAFVIWKNMTAEATDTIDRKYFHFIMVLVCIPGVFLDFRLLYISSVAAVCAFVILEVIRLLRIEICHVPVGDMIENCVKIFRDSKDEGVTILTPVYLLAGCSLPFWLNLVDPRADVTNLTGPSVAAAFAGILSIGVGDTFASVGGLAFGKTKWKGSNKSVEGTLCSLVAQLLVIGALWASDLSSLGMTTVTSLVIAAVINAFVEAKTDQIDNLVLPLLTYDVIIGVEKALLWYYVQQRPI